MKKYFLIINNNQFGPYSLSELQNISINKDTLVWHKSLTEWTKAENIDELAAILHETPPPIPQKRDETTKRIIVDSPIDINIRKTPNNVPKVKNAVKRMLYEIAIILLILVSSAFIALISYEMILNIEKPDLVSEKNQRLFNEEHNKRLANYSAYVAFGDIYSKYLGFYKYDEELTSIVAYLDINTARMHIVKKKSRNMSWNIFYFLIGSSIAIRYIIKLFKWMNEDGLAKDTSQNSFE